MGDAEDGATSERSKSEAVDDGDEGNDEGKLRNLGKNNAEERLIEIEEVKQHCFEDSAWMVIGDGV